MMSKWLLIAFKRNKILEEKGYRSAIVIGGKVYK